MDGRKRCKNEKLFIRFQETENGGFRKRISVDRALVGLLLFQVVILTTGIMNRILCDTHVPVLHVNSDDCLLYILRE